jgi:hypothetical protein
MSNDRKLMRLYLLRSVLMGRLIKLEKNNVHVQMQNSKNS